MVIKCVQIHTSNVVRKVHGERRLVDYKKSMYYHPPVPSFLVSHQSSVSKTMHFEHGCL